MSKQTTPANDDLVAVLWTGQLLPFVALTPGGQVVVLFKGKARTLAVNEPYAVVRLREVLDFDLPGWQRSTRREVEDQAAAAERAKVCAALEAGLFTRRVVLESLPEQRERENALRRDVLDQLGAEGVARRVALGRERDPYRPLRACWVLARPAGSFRPERDPGAKVLVVRASGLSDGVHRLVGMEDGCPCVLTWPAYEHPRVRLVRDGRWRKPGAEDPQRWIEVTRQELGREARPSTRKSGR